MTCIDSAYAGNSTCTTACAKQFNTLPTQYRFIEYLHEEVWCKKFFLDKITAL